MLAASTSSFVDPIASDMAALDSTIRQQLHSDVALIRQISEYIIAAGGKRLRPMLVLLFSRAQGYMGVEHHLLAAVVEFIHTATLLHDDVVDDSLLRRGRKTANAVFGNSASVLVGDFLYSRSFQMMVKVGNAQIMRVMADATNVIAEGEVLQLLNMRDPDVDERRYLQVIRSKTAKLFEAAAQVGTLLASDSQEAQDAAGEYGRSLGTAFQLIDDVLDYTGNIYEIGKNLGDDLREGKPTLPLIQLMKDGSIQERELIRNCIENGDQTHFDKVLEAITLSGALEYTREQARNAAANAQAAVLCFPDSPYRDSLIKLCAFAVDRRY